MDPVIGNVSRRMTRSLTVRIYFLQELVLWSTHLHHLNNRVLNSYSETHTVVCSDASSVSLFL